MTGTIVKLTRVPSTLLQLCSTNTLITTSVNVNGDFNYRMKDQYIILIKLELKFRMLRHNKLHLIVVRLFFLDYVVSDIIMFPLA